MAQTTATFDLIETMRADAQGVIDLWDLHMARLRDSAQALSYPPISVAQVQSQVQEALQVAEKNLESGSTPSQWRVRLLLSTTGQITVAAYPLAPLTQPQRVAFSEVTLQSDERLLQHKTTFRPWYESATAWLANHTEFFDVIFCNERGELCEGTRSNVYVYDDGQWFTPPKRCGLLGGVWRAHLLQTGQVQERVIRCEDLTPQTSLRLSNGLRGWFDVMPDLSTRVV